ncbi:amidohydrolase family protein [Pediococcus acidilactici]|uniref:amidohydrolase family protein n=1 Tax=Pediococcus acidilactici TaxID=1254 RepID=UPI00097E88A9|nr:amidohydrolase family protein [Pediococcus acidilactici]QDJ23190.1 guanine deaminase [Pediococcus acidilactici]SJM45862.1 Guanine deaminase [Pediococcus acidilactici]
MGIINYKKIIKGSFFSAETTQKVNFVKDALVVIDEKGMIDDIVLPKEVKYRDLLVKARTAKKLIELADDEYLLPGFIDLHIHAPQWPQAGMALDKPLNEWLDEYTFPLEAKYQDTDFARKSYHHLVRNLVNNGTTTALYFGTIHEAANLVLAEECNQLGQRAFIGQVVMDNPEQTPAYYRNASTKAAINSTVNFIEKIQEKFSKAPIFPVVTPRFIPSCLDETLLELGKLARERNLLIQSHCSESDWEHGYVMERFGKSDAKVLQEMDLLTDRSIMAHGTLLGEADLAIFQQTHAAIAHCPISNAYFGNAVLPVRKILEKITVGLGSDISGGFSASIYRNIQQAIISARMLEDGVDNRVTAEQRGVANSRISAAQAFYMATVNGARALHIPAGQIKRGCYADLQIVRDGLAEISSTVPTDIFSRLMYQTNPDDISKVLIAGNLVSQK